MSARRPRNPGRRSKVKSRMAAESELVQQAATTPAPATVPAPTVPVPQRPPLTPQTIRTDAERGFPAADQRTVTNATVTYDQLRDRQARCCRDEGIKPSSRGLALFDYQGAGSLAAEDRCKCGFDRSAHLTRAEGGTTSSGLPISCKRFEARGPLPFDRYYCGHAGWN